MFFHLEKQAKAKYTRKSEEREETIKYRKCNYRGQMYHRQTSERTQQCKSEQGDPSKN